MEGLGRSAGRGAEQGSKSNQGVVLALPRPTSSIFNLMVCKDLSALIS